MLEKISGWDRRGECKEQVSESDKYYLKLCSMQMQKSNDEEKALMMIAMIIMEMNMELVKFVFQSGLRKWD